MNDDQTVGPHASQLLEERVDDEVVVYNRAIDAYYTLNVTAAAVWDLTAEPILFGDMLSTLAGQFGMDVDAIRPDVVDIVTRFEEAGLLVS